MNNFIESYARMLDLGQYMECPRCHCMHDDGGVPAEGELEKNDYSRKRSKWKS